MTQDASSRNDDRATNLARQLESDDINEENAAGQINNSKDDSYGNNSVSSDD